MTLSGALQEMCGASSVTTVQAPTTVWVTPDVEALRALQEIVVRTRIAV